MIKVQMMHVHQKYLIKPWSSQNSQNKWTALEKYKIARLHIEIVSFTICFILKKVHTAIHFRCNWKQWRSAIKSGFKVKQPKILCFVFIVIFIWLFLCDIYIKVIKSFNFWDWRVLVHIQIIFYDVQPEVLYFIYLFWK